MVYFCHQRSLWTAAVLCCSCEKVLSFPNSHKSAAALEGHSCASVNTDLAVSGVTLFMTGFITRELLVSGFGGQQGVHHQQISHVTAPPVSQCELSELWHCAGAICDSCGPCHQCCLCCSLASQLCSLSYLSIFILLSAWRVWLCDGSTVPSEGTVTAVQTNHQRSYSPSALCSRGIEMHHKHVQSVCFLCPSVQPEQPPCCAFSSFPFPFAFRASLWAVWLLPTTSAPRPICSPCRAGSALTVSIQVLHCSGQLTANTHFYY